MHIYLLYGSQTGNAQEISHYLSHILKENIDKCEITVDKLNNYSENYEILNNSDYVIFVCSTTGNGDFPENASRFWRKIKSRKLEKELFSNVNYSVCALGDTNYSMFCFAGKNLNKRMSQLSAKEILPIFCMDAVDDDEEQLEKYISLLLEKLN
tara:strand:+ start:685 stop:1146 length:462 start_codon:yes stop_codon:yes gene_type:complete